MNGPATTGIVEAWTQGSAFDRSCNPVCDQRGCDDGPSSQRREVDEVATGEARPQMRQQLQRNHWDVGDGETLVGVVQVLTNALASAPPSQTYITVTIAHAARHSTSKHVATNSGAPKVVAVRHAPPRPATPSASV